MPKNLVSKLVPFLAVATGLCGQTASTEPAVTSDPTHFTITENGIRGSFLTFAYLPDDARRVIDEFIYMGLHLPPHAFFSDITGKMESFPIDANEDNAKVLSLIGKLVELKGDKIVFEISEEFVKRITNSPNFHKEPGFDNRFHSVTPGQERIFNLKSNETDPKASPLHIVGIKDGNRYLAEIHVDPHPDGIRHAIDTAGGVVARHIPPFKYLFSSGKKWSSPFKIQKQLEQNAVDTHFTATNLKAEAKAYRGSQRRTRSALSTHSFR